MARTKFLAVIAALILLSLVFSNGCKAQARSPSPPKLVMQLGPASYIETFALNADGKLLATADDRGVTTIWDVRTGREIKSTNGEKTFCLAFSPDGKWLALSGPWSHAELWAIQNDQTIKFDEDDDGCDHSKMKFSSDGRELVSMGWASGHLDFRNLSNGTAGHLYSFHSRKTFSIDRSGGLIAIVNDDGSVVLYDLQTKKMLKSFDGKFSDVDQLEFDLDGKNLILMSERSVRRLNLQTGAIDFLQKNDGANSRFVGLSLIKGFSVSANSDKSLSLNNIETGQFIRALDPAPWGVKKLLKYRGGELAPDWVRTAAISADGSVVAVSDDGVIGLWETATGKHLSSIEGKGNPFNEIQISPDGASLVATGFDASQTHAWSLKNGRLQVIKDGNIGRFAFTKDSQYLLTARSNFMVKKAPLHKWHLENGIQKDVVDKVSPGEYVFSISKNGVLLAKFREKDKSVGVFNVSSGQEISRFARKGDMCQHQLSPSGRYLVEYWCRTVKGDDSVKVASIYDTSSGSLIHELPVDPYHGDIVFSEDEETLVSFRRFGDARDTGRGGNVELWNLRLGNLIKRISIENNSITSLVFGPDGKILATGLGDKSVVIWSIETGQPIQKLVGHEAVVYDLAFHPNGKWLFSGAKDQRIKIWRLENGVELGTLASFSDGSWVVSDPYGRYDSSDSGVNPNLHWVVGLTPIEIEQLKERYYDPGLLTKLLGANKDPLRTVPPFDLASVKLPPLVELSRKADDDTTVLAQFKDEGGGIGRIRVRLNGKEILTDASSLLSIDSASAAKASLSIPIPVERLQPGLNSLDVVAFNAENHIRSRLASIQFESETISGRGVTSVRAKTGSSGDDAPPTLFVIAMGVSRYAAPDERMNLQFSGKDAADLTQALLLGGQRLFGAGHVNAQLLTDASTDKVRAAVEGQAASPSTNVLQISSPTRAALQAAFANVAKQAKPTDIVVVSLAGHGVMTPSNGLDPGDYHYLTREAQSTDLSDPAVRSLWAVSSAELTEWIKAIKANKQVLVLDTCAAGGAVDKLIAKRDMPGSHKIALERLKDRTGFHILAGAAADRVSYEASRYGQGLLTYALLSGLRGAALREGEFADVSTLFQYAVDEVPKLAKGIGGLQSPLIASPKGSSFDIGRLTADEKVKVPLALVRPLVLRAQIQSDDFEDNLRLEARLNARLRMQNQNATRGGMIYVDAEDHPDGWRLRARYSKQEQGYLLVGVLFQGGQAKAKLQVSLKEDESGQIDDLMAALTPLVH